MRCHGLGVPASSASHGDACAPEAVGDGLRVDPEPIGNIGQRQSGCVQLSGLAQRIVVPDGRFATTRDTLAVEMGRDRGPVDAELDGEFVDGGASSIGLNESVDAGGGEASLGRV